jgi:hypothetical protein
MKFFYSTLSLMVAFLNGMAVAADEQPTPEAIAFFETKIRPVLVEHCYKCHSAAALEANNLQSELVLDTREGIRKGGESGPAIVPGDVKASTLISAIRHESFAMPPKSRLPKSVIDDFVKWVESGAADPRDGKKVEIVRKDVDVAAGKKFWSFQPLAEAVPPEVKNAAWAKNEVDRFILARQEAAGIAANTMAARRTLIRRAYFDLWGLPPDPEDVQAFVSDESPDAYSQLIDRLLDGQHYGERWARHWLDLARFAESNGYAFDKDRPAAYHYRDFVIKALNADMPYDQFVKLQIAGDQLAPLEFDAQAATGFLAAGPFTSQQTQKERERSRYEQLDDIVATLGTSMLGLTIGCARCHDHKFDPIGDHDYYRLTASFAETGFQDYDWDPDPEGTRKAKAAFDAEHKPYLDARAKLEKEVLPGRLDEWLKTRAELPRAEKLGVWHAIGPFPAASYDAAFKQSFAQQAKVELDKPIGDLKWTARPEWKDETVHNTLTGDNSANYLYRTIDVASNVVIDVSFGCDDGIVVFLNGNQILSKPTMGGAAPDQHLVKLNLTTGTNHLLVKIVNGSGPSGFYFSAQGVATPKNVQDILDLDVAKWTEPQRQVVLKWFAPRDAEWFQLDREEKEHLAKAPTPDITKIFAARRNGATYNFGADTRKVYFLARGNSNVKTGLASPGFLRVLMEGEHQEKNWLLDEPTSEKPATVHPRIALGEWLTDTDAGAGNLLARVIVNRLWQHHLGTGIVNTPSDFGSQGTPPTHPQLLDYLARQLVQNGWKLKPIHRLIMNSATYQQSGAVNDAASKIDPDNQLWWRRPPGRLEAEIIRDNLFAVSGTLDKTMHGPGSLDQATPRRSVYLTVKRGSLIPILQLFDAPDAIQSIGNRDVTTVPPQALAMMNSPFVRKVAEQFAARINVDKDLTTEGVVLKAYWLALSRPPEADEVERMTAFLSSQAQSYGNDEKAKTTALADYCQIMLCLNEFVVID